MVKIKPKSRIPPGSREASGTGGATGRRDCPHSRWQQMRRGTHLETDQPIASGSQAHTGALIRTNIRTRRNSLPHLKKLTKHDPSPQVTSTRRRLSAVPAQVAGIMAGRELVDCGLHPHPHAPAPADPGLGGCPHYLRRDTPSEHITPPPSPAMMDARTTVTTHAIPLTPVATHTTPPSPSRHSPKHDRIAYRPCLWPWYLCETCMSKVPHVYQSQHSTSLTQPPHSPS